MRVAVESGGSPRPARVVAQGLKGALKALGLFHLAKAVYYKAKFQALKVGLLKWRPLVVEEAFQTACVRAIDALKARGHKFGDYLEFGVSRGTSLVCMHKALNDAGLTTVRAIGFDSFEGMPPGSEAEGWLEGEFASSLPMTSEYLRRRGVDMSRVHLVKGWFRDTCTPETATRLGLERASIIMVDCDIYSASCDALRFAGPLIGDEAVIIFDDWGWRSDYGGVGEKEAFEEFLAANPGFRYQPLETYLPQARMFLLERA